VIAILTDNNVYKFDLTTDLKAGIAAELPAEFIIK